jgi:urease accessory protein
MRARARIVAEVDGRGGTRLAEVRGESPLLFRRTGPYTVHLVGGAAGPLRGDDLHLEIEVRPGARLEIRSVAASLALPGRAGQPASRLRVDALVGAEATLRWLPEPLIAAAGCDHRTITRVEASEGATLLWRDDVVCGRHKEPSGNVQTDITIRYAHQTLYRHELSVGPSAPGWSSPAILGSTHPTIPTSSQPTAATNSQAPTTRGHHAPVPNNSQAAVVGGGRAVGSVVLAGPDLPPPALLGGDAALMPLAGPGMLATAVGPDIRTVRAALDAICDLQTSRPSARSTPATRSDPPLARRSAVIP